MAMNQRQLARMARSAIQDLQRKLPATVAARACQVPIVFMARPTAAMIREDGLEPDLLGLFVGANSAETAENAAPLPPEILLFLENLWECAAGDPQRFREEVQITYFHELGHYLGLEEDELEERGLE